MTTIAELSYLPSADTSFDPSLPAPRHAGPRSLGLVRDFDQELEERSLRVGVVGLGFTGLPLAHGFADAGFGVTGVDLDLAKIDAIHRGESYLPDLDTADLRRVADRLRVSSEIEQLAEADAYIICVPTPVTIAGGADLDFVWAAAESLRPHVRPGVLVVLQSTVPPGTTTRLGELLVEGTDLVIGRDVHLAIAPERVDPANTNGWDLRNTPKLVGGVGEEGTRRAARLFEQVCQHVHTVSDPAVAELSKVYENTFRLVNIALSIELADLCRSIGVSAREVIDAAATKPFGFLAHYPGPGVGGECIPVDPLFLIERAAADGVDFGVAATAQRRVAGRPAQVVDRVAEMLAASGRAIQDARVLVVGVSYKPNVADLRNAPGVEILSRLRAEAFVADYHDALIPEVEVDGEWVRSVRWSEQRIAAYDAVVLVTAHGAMATDPRWAAAALVLDTRGELAPSPAVTVL